jgi:hypothetical protein
LAKFEPLIRKPGEFINAEDWNSIQEGLLGEISRLEGELIDLKKYVDNMSESLTLMGVESHAGKAYTLDSLIPGEIKTYEIRAMGLITRQWVPAARGVKDTICEFGITDFFEVLQFWAGAENGEKKMLDIELRYVDGTSEKIGANLFVNDRNDISLNRDNENPYLEFISSPNRTAWYKYQVANKNPKKKVGYVTFNNNNPECTPRIGNVIHLRSKIKQMS